MNNDDTPKDRSLVPVTKEGGLTIRSSRLASRGLESLQALDRDVGLKKEAAVGESIVNFVKKDAIQTQIELVKIAAGKFMMGSDKYDGEKPIHQVNIDYSFFMGKYQVTQAQWAAIMDSNPSLFSEDGGNHPVEKVSWEDAKEFIHKLNNLQNEYEYRLPSEAEWEYACRSGTSTEFSYGDSLSSEQANFDGNYPYGGAAKGKYLEKTTAVGSYLPNAWGLYDMHGNVWEWCEDIWNGNYEKLPTDGSANVRVGDR